MPTGVGTGVGATVGSVVPGVGTAIGAALGGAYDVVSQYAKKKVDWTTGKSLSDVKAGTSGSIRKRDYDIIAHYAGVPTTQITAWQVAMRSQGKPVLGTYQLKQAIQTNGLAPEEVAYVFNNLISFSDYMKNRSKIRAQSGKSPLPTGGKKKTNPVVLLGLGLAALKLFKG